MIRSYIELMFLELMEAKGVEDEAGLENFYGWMVSILEEAVYDFKADAGWEEDEDAGWEEDDEDD